MQKARLIIIGTTTTLAVALVATPAAAAPTDDTTVTFAVAAGTLDVVAPAAADMGTTTAPGTAFAGQMGPVTVTDTRAAADASWEATATSTDFTTGGATPGETVLATEVDYWSGPATATTGNGTFTPGQPTAAAAAPLDNVAPLIVFTHTGGTGNNSATWNPTMILNLPLDSIEGTYTGVVTHSVA